MATLPDRPVLITGASGALGKVLTEELAAKGWTLKLTDLAPFPGPVPAGSSFTRADLGDGLAILRLAEGCGTIIHMGGVSVEMPFETVLGPNLRGVFHIFEAARREKARVIFASSNHAFGFQERTATLDEDAPFRPDGFYGLSKAYGELMGRLYWDKHGVECVSVRIGSATPEPVDARMLASWFSYPDVIRLMECCVLAKHTGSIAIWGASKNTRMTWWGGDSRKTVGWDPVDSADAFIDRLSGKTSGNPVAERYQGGGFTTIDYSRP